MIVVLFVYCPCPTESLLLNLIRVSPCDASESYGLQGTGLAVAVVQQITPIHAHVKIMKIELEHTHQPGSELCNTVSSPFSTGPAQMPLPRSSRPRTTRGKASSMIASYAGKDWRSFYSSRVLVSSFALWWVFVVSDVQKEIESSVMTDDSEKVPSYTSSNRLRPRREAMTKHGPGEFER